MNEISKIRVAINKADKYGGISVQCTAGIKFSDPTQIWFAYIPKLLAPKIAILKVSGTDANIQGVGRQALPDVFYIEVTPSEWTQLTKEADHHGNTTRSINEGGYQRSNC